MMRSVTIIYIDLSSVCLTEIAGLAFTSIIPVDLGIARMYPAVTAIFIDQLEYKRHMTHTYTGFP